MLFLAIAAVVELLTVATSALVISVSRSNARVGVPDAVHRLLNGSCGTALWLNHEESRIVNSSTCDSQETPTFDEWRERRQRWLMLAQAVDRLLFLVLGFITIGFFS
uniref:Secreted protein n=1 Tax=Amblyomma triste TaxID=251400 RepID=A0A023G432_AMBTT